LKGELGVLAGVEDEVSAEHHTYTDPEEVIDFVSKTHVDSLAISIGTSHGAYKFKPEQCHVDPATGRLVPPPLHSMYWMQSWINYPDSQSFFTDHLQYLRKKLIQSTNMVENLKLPLVFLKISYAKLQSLLFVKSTSILTAALAMTAAIRKTFAEKPAEFDPRKYLGPARDNMEKLYKHKIVNVLGSNDKL